MTVTSLTSHRITGSRWAGLASATLVALSPLAVDQSRLITPDTYAGLLFAAATLAAVLLLADGRPRTYLLAGLAVGLAASAKYNAVLAAVPVVVAHLLRTRGRILDDRSIYLAGLASVVGFLATTPFALLDASTFLSHLRFEIGHYATGHTGAEGGAMGFYLVRLRELHGPLLLLGGIGAVLAPKTTRPGLLVVLSGVVVYLLVIGQQTVRFERNLMPLLGPLLTVVGVGIWSLLHRLRTDPSASPAPVQRWLRWLS